MNESPQKISSAAIISLYALALLGIVGGWYILLSGGFYHQNGRYSQDFTFVGGPMALAMVAIEFAMTAIGVAAIIQYSNYAKHWYVLGCGAVLVPPVLYVLFWHFG